MQIIRMATGSKTNLQMVARLLILAILLSITAAFIVQPARAENTYVITDGDNIIVHVSNETDLETVLEDAGLELQDDDKYTVGEANHNQMDILIQRASHVTIRVDGSSKTVNAYGETVGQLLKEQGIRLSDYDRVTWPLDYVTYDGMLVDVIRVTHKLETKDETIPCTTRRYEVAGLPEGEIRLLSAGTDGNRRVTSYVTYENGAEVARKVTEDVITAQPSEQVILTGKNTPAVEGALPGAELGTAKAISCLGTAYSCDGRKGITATGTVVHIGTVAVDPKVIPLGSKLFIVSDDGQYVYGDATAEDTGGLIKGNRVDLYMNTTAECFQFGARRVTVYVLE